MPKRTRHDSDESDPENINEVRFVRQLPSSEGCQVALCALRSGTHVVIKRMLSGAALPSKEHEILLRALHSPHPNVVDIMSLTHFECRMSWYNVGSLGDYVRSADTPCAIRVDNLMRDVVDGYRFLHYDLQIIHGDIKPCNVLVRANAEGVRAALCDFGSSIMVGDDYIVTESETWTSLPVIAPEQILDPLQRLVSPDADAWSIGCVAFFAMSGRLPFDGITRLNMAHQHAKHVGPTSPRVRRHFDKLLCELDAGDRLVPLIRDGLAAAVASESAHHRATSPTVLHGARGSSLSAKLWAACCSQRASLGRLRRMFEAVE